MTAAMAALAAVTALLAGLVLALRAGAGWAQRYRAQPEPAVDEPAAPIAPAIPPAGFLADWEAIAAAESAEDHVQFERFERVIVKCLDAKLAHFLRDIKVSAADLRQYASLHPFYLEGAAS